MINNKDLGYVQFKLGYVEEQLFVAASLNSYKNVSFMTYV